MAVKLKHTICESSDCKSINFRELTGTYDATDNPTGWGVPNELITDALTATLVLKSPNETSYPAIDLLALGFPKEVPYVATKILASTVDSTLTELSDGFWNVTYTVTTSTETYTQSKSYFLYNNVKKEVCKLIADLRLTDCSCNPESLNRVLQMNAYLLSLGHSVSLGDTTSAIEIYEALQNLIDCSICK